MTGTAVEVLKGHRGLTKATFSASGKKILSYGIDGTAKIWDGRTGERKATINGNTRSIRHASFSRDERRIITAGDDLTHTLDYAAISARIQTYADDSQFELVETFAERLGGVPDFVVRLRVAEFFVRIQELAFVGGVFGEREFCEVW